nr:unnamed protein product [uncultured bacterium]
MNQVFDLLFSCFERIVAVMRSIEIFSGVDLLTFSIAVVIMSIVIVGVLNVVKTGPTNAQGYYKSEKHKAEERAKRKHKGG